MTVRNSYGLAQCILNNFLLSCYIIIVMLNKIYPKRNHYTRWVIYICKKIFKKMIFKALFCAVLTVSLWQWEPSQRLPKNSAYILLTQLWSSSFNKDLQRLNNKAPNIREAALITLAGTIKFMHLRIV